MTFDEIVTEIKDRAGLSSATAITRIGREVNIHYKVVTSELGIAPTSRPVIAASANTTIGSPNVTFTSMVKVDRVRDQNVTPYRNLDEVSLDELMRETPASSSSPQRYAIEEMTGTSVIIRLDVLAATVFALKADGVETVATLSGTDVPNFPVDFHDILVEHVLGQELDKQEKGSGMSHLGYAKDRMSRLRLHIARSASKSVRQGGRDNSVLFTIRNY
jgi:hypothetical protein